MDLQPVKVQAEIMWAFLDTPNQLSGKYQVDLCNLSSEAVSKLQTMGVNVRKKDDQPEKGFFVTAKSVNYPIKAEDRDGNPVAGKVGNGSKAIALLKPYEYTYQKKKGVAIGVNKLIITDLVVYEAEATEEVLDDVL
jgi:hypothetical protein